MKRGAMPARGRRREVSAHRRVEEGGREVRSPPGRGQRLLPGSVSQRSDLEEWVGATGACDGVGFHGLGRIRFPMFPGSELCEADSSAWATPSGVSFRPPPPLVGLTRGICRVGLQHVPKPAPRMCSKSSATSIPGEEEARALDHSARTHSSLSLGRPPHEDDLAAEERHGVSLEVSMSSRTGRQEVRRGVIVESACQEQH